MIYIVEGPDGVGKSTLANEIAQQTGASILHCSYDKEWDMQKYQMEMFKIAKQLNKYKDVVIDRWAPSEFVYGNVFREGPSYDVMGYLWELDDSNIKWIYCRNDNAVENHLKHKENRIEMFEDMSKVVEEFHKFVEDTNFLNWKVYDFDKVNRKKFVKELIS